jgi:hypothetical protein
MSVDFSNVADDFFINVSVQTTLPLPSSRETILHFYEAVQKEFAAMTNFYQREGGEYVLEGDRDSGHYDWIELQSHNLASGSFNPDRLEAGYRFHRWLLERSVYYLGLGGLDVEALDVLFGFNLDFRGNRDAVVAQALLGGSSLGALAGEPLAKALEFEPSLVVSLDEACDLQARLSLETRSSSYQVRTGQYDDEPISVYFTIRSYPRPGRLPNLVESLERQSSLGEDLAERIVVPQIVQEIAAAIAASQ